MKQYVSRLLSPLVHPIGGFEDYRELHFFPVLPGVVILALFFFGRVLEQQCTGFIFNWSNPRSINVWLILLETVVLFMLWVCCNWAVSTLFDGRGRSREIFSVSAVALLPYVVSIYINVLLSNVFLEAEGMFMTWIAAVGVLYSLLLLVGALSSVHEYSFGKVLWSTLLTVAFMVIVLFICVLLFSLFQQVFGFIQDLSSEISFRT